MSKKKPKPKRQKKSAGAKLSLRIIFESLPHDWRKPVHEELTRARAAKKIYTHISRDMLYDVFKGKYNDTFTKEVLDAVKRLTKKGKLILQKQSIEEITNQTLKDLKLQKAGFAGDEQPE